MNVQINEKLLARAVREKIRPVLIDQNQLEESGEGYHHKKIIPKARPLLARQSLESGGGVQPVLTAINASDNLLSRFEKPQAKGFLERQPPDEAVRRVVALLYGEGPLDERLATFLTWAKPRKFDDGKPYGINGTVASYLLAMSDPTRYAFCKPEIYQAAAINLLGTGEARQDQAERIVHANAFYADALKLFREQHGLPFTDLMHTHIAFFVVDRYLEVAPSWAGLTSMGRNGASEEKHPRPEQGKHMSLNTILYGPPGTGKTYRTVRRAVEICDGTAPPEPSKVQDRFRQLRDARRIEFVTFHQSYGYEEFVEGIRPLLVGDQGEPANKSEIQYECRDGVFKRICSLARGTGTVAKGGTSVDLDKQKVWKMSLGNTNDPDEADVYDQCIEQGQIRLGYGMGLDFSGCGTRDEVAAKLREASPSMADTDYNIQSVHLFKNNVQVGDLVVISDGNRYFRAVGEVTGEYRWINDDSYSQTRTVRWLLVLDESLPVDRILTKVFSQASIYQLHQRVLRVVALTELLSGKPKSPENYVLVIDEINRGNISKVFGELITLIEPDKRIGGANELRVTLPYSADTFGVPGNLHIVGTMNTADRSIAVLDTALRRRFRFEEMMPDLDVVRATVGSGGVVGGIDVAALLERINARIELLFDRDHQIGHAYFLGVRTLEDLRDTFRHQVIPLLQEYFYGDWAKICHVLGCPHDPVTGKPVSKNPLPLIRVVSLDGLLHGGQDADDAEPRFRYELNASLAGASADLADCFRWVHSPAAAPAGNGSKDAASPRPDGAD